MMCFARRGRPPDQMALIFLGCRELYAALEAAGWCWVGVRRLVFLRWLFWSGRLEP